MTTLSTFPLRDTATMLRRDVKHQLRYWMMTLSGILVPVVMLLLFKYVFGAVIAGGMFGALDGGTYVNYLLPGILVMTVGAGSAATAINISADMTEGVIDRFRTMSIFRPAILTAQVIGSGLRTMVTLVLVVAVGYAIGFRPEAGLLDWLGVTGLLVLFVLGITWTAMAMGMLAKTPGGANSTSMPFQFFLPFLSSSFVDPDSMPTAIRWFVANQPFTHVIDTLRALLLGTPVGDHALWAVVWCLVLIGGGFAWSVRVFNRRKD